MPYAHKTQVPVIKSKHEIEMLVMKHGGDQFVSGWTEDAAQVGFRVNDRMLRFRIPMKAALERCRTQKQVEQKKRQMWRALLLAVKAKFEIVESGIETFEEAFLSNIVMSDGQTVGDWAAPQIAHMYEQGNMPPLLPGPTQ